MRIEKLTNFNKGLQLLTGSYWRGLVRKEMSLGVQRAARVVQVNVRQGILNGRPEWPPIHPYTSALREFRGHGGSEKPLVETGTLARNIVVEVMDQGQGVPTATVGIPPSVYVTRVSGGQEKPALIQLASLARMQEGGFSIEVTWKMREFFKRRGLRLSLGTTHIRVPARAFLVPGVRDSEDDVKFIFAAAMSSILSRVKVDAEHASRLLRSVA